MSLRSDQEEYEEQFKQLNLQRHVLKAHAIWDMPDLSLSSGGARKAIGYLINDWQLSGVWTGNSGGRYDLGVGFQNNGGNVNMTGSPDFGARPIYLTAPGAGCSDNQYAQFDVTQITAPTYFSDGLESGRNLLIGCPNNVIDFSLARNIRMGGGRELKIQVDAFNAFNVVNYNGRNTTLTFATPTDLTVQNNQYNADGTLNQARVLPRNAGFGAANGAGDMRNFQASVRFLF